MSQETTGRGNIIPTMRYRDASAAVEWLCRAFGFEKHLVVEGAPGTIEHAQLTLAGGMIMLGSERDSELGKLVRAPKPGQPLTQSPYIVIEDIDAHYERAKAAGADIVMPIEDQPYGGRLYSARDPEGHLWSFGSYDPWVE